MNIEQKIKLAQAEVSALDEQIKEQVKRGAKPDELMAEYRDLSYAKDKLSNLQAEMLGNKKIQSVVLECSEQALGGMSEDLLIAMIGNTELVKTLDDLEALPPKAIALAKDLMVKVTVASMQTKVIDKHPEGLEQVLKRSLDD